VEAEGSVDASMYYCMAHLSLGSNLYWRLRHRTIQTLCNVRDGDGVEFTSPRGVPGNANEKLLT
jgi:hypothetical protein